MATRQQRNPLGLPSKKDALESIRKDDFLRSNGKSIYEIESEDALEEEQ